jgi:spermidine/putrescine-binding protein
VFRWPKKSDGDFSGFGFGVPSALATTQIVYNGRVTTAYAFDVPLRVAALRQSFPSSASNEFARTQGSNVKFKLSTTASVAETYASLANYGKKTRDCDACTLGDEWLQPAIERGLIMPIPNAETSEWFKALPPVWKALVRRDPRTGGVSASGEIYGAPYRFGCVTFAYRKDKLPKGVKPPMDWNDLFDPRLKGLIGMPNAPRLVLSAALKAEGLSVNTNDIGGVDGRVSERVRTLRKNVKVFDDLQYLQAIACGDCAVVVGPSEDIFSVARRSTLVIPIIPQSGTSLWSDIWVVPSAASRNKGGMPSPVLEQWIDYTLQPQRINMRVGLKGGISPLMFDGRGIESGYARYPSISRPALGGDDEDMLKGWIPDDSVWAASEFQLPLSDRVRSQYVAMSKFIVQK